MSDVVYYIDGLTLVGNIKDLPNRAEAINPTGAISIIFNGRNFPEWRQRIQDVLIKQLIWQKVYKVNRPLKGKELDEFRLDQMVAKSTIRGYMEAEYLHLVDPQDHELTIEEMLDQIAEKYDWKNSMNEKFAFLMVATASNHIVNDPYLARDFRPCRAKLQGFGGGIVNATARGNLQLRTKGGHIISLQNVLFAPNIRANYLSTLFLPGMGLMSKYMANGVQILKGNTVIASVGATSDNATRNMIDFYVD